jgi:hypothetical protein
MLWTGKDVKMGKENQKKENKIQKIQQLDRNNHEK